MAIGLDIFNNYNSSHAPPLKIPEKNCGVKAVHNLLFIQDNF